MASGRQQPARSVTERVRTSGTYGTIYTAGRPPWFNVAGEARHNAFVIGIAGGSASGKSSVANRIIDSMGIPWVANLSQDSFYRPLTEEQMAQAHENNYDFDHPDALDLDLLTSTLKKLKDGERADIPVYDFGTHSRLDEIVPMYGASVVVFEGLFAFATPGLRELIDLKIFVDEDPDIRMARRMRRDIAERNRDLHGVIQQWKRFVKPSFETHIKPTMTHADLVIPRGISNAVAMDLLIKEVRKQLDRRGLNIRKELRTMPVGEKLPSTVRVVPKSKQLHAFLTTMCNVKTPQEEFAFAADATMAILFEYMLSVIPHKTAEITLASGIDVPTQAPTKRIVGVTVLRAGLTMEAALGRCVQAVALGRLLIQTNAATGEPELHHASLPDVTNCTVVLMDPLVASGAAAMMAVRVLLDHGVAQSDIFLSTLFSTDRGLHAVTYAFPRVNIIAASLEHKLDEKGHLDPGLGNFGDRYFGTVQAELMA